MVTTIKAYAKINLALNVYDKRENGYHDVDMIMIPLALHDIVELELLPYGYETYITSDDSSLPTDESNLSIKAFSKLREQLKLDKNFMIHIYKRIPISAGLGGGSADAAAVLNGVLKITKNNVSNEKMIEIAQSIGGDVAFCLYNKAARCRGIGEKLEFIKMKRKYHVLLIKPNEGVSTAQAYHDFDELEVKPQLSNIDELIRALENDDEEVVLREMKNCLQEPAMNLVPEIKKVIETLKNDGFPLTMMSGSGSTVFALSKDGNAIAKEAKKFDKNKYKIVVTTTL